VQFALRVMHGDGGFSAFWHRAGAGEMSTLAAIDLVIAMPISWLPLVADYARYGRLDGIKNAAFKGTWAGYVIANIWCYALGVMVVSVAPEGDLVSTLLLAQFGLIALGFILIDEMDNAYGDVHSGAVSLNHLMSKTSITTWGKGFAIVAIIAAMMLDMHGLEPFLLMLSSVFVPLYGVIIARLAFKENLSSAQPTIHLPSAVVWLIGIAVFHLCAQLAPQYGSAIPSLIVTLGLGMLVRKMS
jgi:NCS1 family nucleobase:cation symporter-1